MKRGTWISKPAIPLGEMHLLDYVLFGHCSEAEVQQAIETEDLPPVYHQHRWGMWVKTGWFGQESIWSLLSQRSYARGLFPVTVLDDLEPLGSNLKIQHYRYPKSRKPERPHD